MIDLHMHSTFSDGSMTPRELVEEGQRIGLTAMALTDHDCLSGISLFMQACSASAEQGYRDGAGMQGIAGVEISVDVAKGTMHMLGYHVTPGHDELEAALSRIRDGRAYRNELILQKLNGAGLELSWDEVAQHAGEEVVGRPHFALAMLARGYASDKQEAFDKYLAKGAAAYVDRFRMGPEDSIAVIRAAGGVPVLAHPFTLQLSKRQLRAQVSELKEMGLEGVEVYYSEHGHERVKEYSAIAADLELVATGGSDFHGALNPSIRMGSGFGSLRVSDDIVEQLAARRPA